MLDPCMDLSSMGNSMPFSVSTFNGDLFGVRDVRYRKEASASATGDARLLLVAMEFEGNGDEPETGGPLPDSLCIASFMIALWEWEPNLTSPGAKLSPISPGELGDYADVSAGFGS